MSSGKIFGIGLPKTGTTSLHEAAGILGLRSVHYAHDPVTVRQLREGDYRLSVMEDIDLVSDIPIPAIFPQLDTAFPGSKFILTCRDEDSWMASQTGAEFNRNLPKPGSHRELYRMLLYGVVHFNEERFRWIYRNHHAAVDRYFSGERAKDLLRVDVTQASGWESVCDFLALPVPDAPFPHRNKANTPEALGKQSTAMGRLRGRLSRSR